MPTGTSIRKTRKWLEETGLTEFTPPPWLLPGVGAFAAAAGITILATSGFSADFVFLIAAIGALCAMVGYDVFSRRRWERDTADKIRTLIGNHDRMVRETARNRSDIAVVKEGLAGIAAEIESQGRRLQPSGSAEAKMIETIIERLGAVGGKPRAQIGTAHDAHVLELEMLPPPLRPAPLSALDEEINPDPDSYGDQDIADLLRHAVRNDGIDVFTQPVVSLPQRKAKFHEAFARIRAGGGISMPASRFLDRAREERMIPAIDNLLLLRCLHELRGQAREGDIAAPYILNVTADTLNDRGFMNDLVAFLSENKNLASGLIFELPQADIESMSGAAAQVLDGLSKLGCRISMDRVRKKQINVALLKSRRVRFVKMDAAWLLREGRDRAGFSRIVQLKKQLDAAGIDLIVEKIENEAMLRELLDYSIDYGQGYLFGKPDIVHIQSGDRNAA